MPEGKGDLRLVVSRGELTDAGKSELLAKREKYKDNWRDLKLEILTLERKLRLQSTEYENKVASLPDRLKELRTRHFELPTISAQGYQFETGVVDSTVDRLKGDTKKQAKEEVATTINAIKDERTRMQLEIERLRKELDEQKQIYASVFTEKEAKLRELENLINEIDKVTKPDPVSRPFNRPE